MKYKLTAEVELTVDPIVLGLARRDDEAFSNLAGGLAETLRAELERAGSTAYNKCFAFRMFPTPDHVDEPIATDPLPAAEAESWGIANKSGKGYGGLVTGNVRWVLFRVE